MAETEDLKSFQCRFESDRGHYILLKVTTLEPQNIPNLCLLRGSCRYIQPMRMSRGVAAIALFLPIALTGCSSQSSGEESDEFKMNQYYDCVQRYDSKGLYTTDEIENVCGGLRP